jgi:hypothetical protein
MPRRDLGFVVAAITGFLIAVAVLLPSFVAGQVTRFPLNDYETATLDASDASYFSVTKLAEVTGVSMQVTDTIKGDALLGSSSTAVWDEFAYSYDKTNKLPVEATSRTVAFNRKTGQLVNCCGASVNGNTAINQHGVVGYVFPIGTKKRTYQVFDTTLDRPMPFVYSGSTTIRGITVYEFAENVAPVQFTTQTVPGSLAGLSTASVTLPEFYQMHVLYYVDPETGALIDVNEHEVLTLQSSGQAITLFDADLIETPASVDAVVKHDASGRNELTLLKVILPSALGLAAVITLVAGILLARKRPDEPDEADDSDESDKEAEAEAPAGLLLPCFPGSRPGEPAARRQIWNLLQLCV